MAVWMVNCHRSKSYFDNMTIIVNHNNQPYLDYKLDFLYLPSFNNSNINQQSTFFLLAGRSGHPLRKSRYCVVTEDRPPLEFWGEDGAGDRGCSHPDAAQSGQSGHLPSPADKTGTPQPYSVLYVYVYA